MGFGMFQATTSPIAIDFGTSSVKMLQVAEGERPELVGAAELAVPDAIRGDLQKQLDYLAEFLPGVIAQAGFRGKRAVIAIPSARTFIQHMLLTVPDETSIDSVLKTELQVRMGASPDSVVVRHQDLGDVNRNGQARREVICFAMARDTVMRYVSLLKRFKLAVVGVHTETHAIVHAFDHVHRRDDDHQLTTLYVDLGHAGTKIAIAHGRDVRFARYVAIGGRHLDQAVAEAMECELEAARAHRIAAGEAAGRTSTAGDGPQGQAILEAARAAHAAASDKSAPAPAVAVDDRRLGDAPPALARSIAAGPPVSGVTAEIATILGDELAMCLRYHQTTHCDRPMDRAVFVGGESRLLDLCRSIVGTLGCHALLGDPLSRIGRNEAAIIGFDAEQPQPGWTVACGLCNAPTDL